MSYLNPILQYGFENFCRQASALGISGFIIPDLPVQEYQQTYAPIIKTYGLHFIFLITPETKLERISLLDTLSSGFIYAVSSSAITGSPISKGLVIGFLERLAGYSLKNPVLAGFGINNKAGFQAACTHANGAIIGSAYIEQLTDEENINQTTANFIQSIVSNEQVQVN